MRTKEVLVYHKADMILGCDLRSFLTYNSVKFFIFFTKSRVELPLYISLIRLHDHANMVILLLFPYWTEDRTSKYFYTWIYTHKVSNEVNWEKLDGIGPSSKFPWNLLQNQFWVACKLSTNGNIVVHILVMTL